MGKTSSDIPHISEHDPLPSPPEPKGRWAMPYLSDTTGYPTVYTRRPLLPSHVEFGLRSCLTAETMDRLKELMAEEDRKYEDYVSVNQSSRNTG